MSWNENIDRSRAFEQAIEQICADNIIDCARLGWETLRAPFLFKVPRHSDPTAEFVRHLPDFVVIIGEETWLLDAKCGETISKSAYDYYMKMENCGLRVGIIVGPADDPRYVHINEVPLKKYEGNWPSIDSTWIDPSKMEEGERRQWVAVYGNDRPFAFLDLGHHRFKKLKPSTSLR